MRFYSATTQEEYQEIYSLLLFPRGYYPDFKGWYWGKVIEGIESKRREIIVAFDEKVDAIVGVVIIKKGKEKKVCTLFVRKEYRCQGIGTKLMQMAIECLKCKTPLFTFPQELAADFGRLMEVFGFKFKKAYNGYYRVGKIECVYNGYLEECNKKGSLIAYKKVA